MVVSSGSQFLAKTVITTFAGVWIQSYLRMAQMKDYSCENPMRTPAFFLFGIIWFEPLVSFKVTYSTKTTLIMQRFNTYYILASRLVQKFVKLSRLFFAARPIFVTICNRSATKDKDDFITLRGKLEHRDGVCMCPCQSLRLHTQPCKHYACIFDQAWRPGQLEYVTINYNF